MKVYKKNKNGSFIYRFTCMVNNQRHIEYKTYAYRPTQIQLGLDKANWIKTLSKTKKNVETNSLGLFDIYLNGKGDEYKKNYNYMINNIRPFLFDFKGVSQKKKRDCIKLFEELKRKERHIC